MVFCKTFLNVVEHIHTRQIVQLAIVFLRSCSTLSPFNEYIIEKWLHSCCHDIVYRKRFNNLLISARIWTPDRLLGTENSLVKWESTQLSTRYVIRVTSYWYPYKYPEIQVVRTNGHCQLIHFKPYARNYSLIKLGL